MLPLHNLKHGELFLRSVGREEFHNCVAAILSCNLQSRGAIRSLCMDNTTSERGSYCTVYGLARVAELPEFSESPLWRV